MGKRTKARECAMQMLYQWDATGQTMTRVAESYWKVRSTTETTREMAERLALGASRDKEPIDEAISGALKNWRFERIAAVDKGILRLATYELMREMQTPSSVILNEAIDLAKRFGEKDSGPFVNGVLDAVSRSLRPYEARPAPVEAAPAGDTSDEED
jgi:N utilization substance protein B